MVTLICNGFTLTDSEVRLNLEHQKNQVHREAGLKTVFIAIRCRIGPERMSVAAQACKHVVELCEIRTCTRGTIR